MDPSYHYTIAGSQPFYNEWFPWPPTIQVNGITGLTLLGCQTLF